MYCLQWHRVALLRRGLHQFSMMNNKNGKKRIEIDFEELDKLCALQCSEQEIADWFNCSVDTIERRVKEAFGISFAEYFSKKRVGGKIALRRNLIKMSEKNPAVAIFLAKNWLGMKDDIAFGKQPIIIRVKYD